MEIRVLHELGFSPKVVNDLIGARKSIALRKGESYSVELMGLLRESKNGFILKIYNEESFYIGKVQGSNIKCHGDLKFRLIGVWTPIGYKYSLDLKYNDHFISDYIHVECQGNASQ